MTNNNEIFIIDNLSKFIESTRVLVFNHFGEDNKLNIDDLSFVISELPKDEIDDLNNSLSQDECEIISKSFIKKEFNKRTKAIRYTISTARYMKMIESFNERLISNMLHNMVNKGILETAFDEKANDFIFWIKDDEKTNEKPETD